MKPTFRHRRPEMTMAPEMTESKAELEARAERGQKSAKGAMVGVRVVSANGATHASQGQRPRNTPTHSSQALKGRDKSCASFAVSMLQSAGWAALQGLIRFLTPYPGRCPGLAWCAPLGLKSGAPMARPMPAWGNAPGTRPHQFPEP